MWGIGPRHIREICETETGWGIIRSYTPSQVGEMTLDQAYLLLCDKKILRMGRERTAKMLPEEVAVNSKGQIKGRTADGKPFVGKFGGESLASRIAKQEEEKALRARETRRERRKRKNEEKQLTQK